MKMTMLGSIFVLLGIAFGLSACTGLGRPLGGERPYHHLEKGFRNPPDSPRRSSDLSVRLPFFAQAVWRSLTQNKWLQPLHCFLHLPHLTHPFTVSCTYHI